jgi:glucose/arabinose dehydrogenase
MLRNRNLLFYLIMASASLLSFQIAQGTALTTTRVASGLSSPLYLCSPPGDTTRQFIVEQTGRIKIIKNGVLLARPFLNITDRISVSSERGLLSLAFHPSYASNRYFYVNYTNAIGSVVLSRFQTTAADPDSCDRTTEHIIMTVVEPEANHNGGTVAFGPDGYLYFGLGDGGGGGDNHGTIGNGQNLNTLLGKILRINIDSGSTYAIPPDNPFVGVAGMDEIWAYGVRNPWRMSFDKTTGDLYIADVGQDTYEEVDFQPVGSPGGQNYGWRLMEGYHCYNPSTNCNPGGLTLPIDEYNHSLGCSITGGFVYRGCRIPDLQGTYFYADYCTGRIWSFRYDGVAKTDSMERTTELAPGNGLSIGNISSFGEDARGELYIIDIAAGNVFKIIPAEPVQSECSIGGCCNFAGDATGDAKVNVGDIVYLINYVFKAGPAPGCAGQADVNSDCSVNVGDAVYMINYVFKLGPAPSCSSCL